MAVIFQVRGTALDAYYARFSKHAGLIYGGSTSAPTIVSGAATGVFGDSYIAKRNNIGNVRGLVYPGFGNTWSGAGFSILWRIIPRWTGTPSVIMNLCSIGSYSGSGLGKIEVSILTSGAIRVRTSNRNQSTLTLNDTSGTTSFTSGTPVDIMLAWDGSTSANAMKVSVDGVELGTMTCASAQSALESLVRTGIIIGAGVDTNHSDYDLNEFVIWDTVESHTYATRTDFISPPSTGDGQISTANAKTGVSFYIPSSFSAQSGTYDGSDRWSDPGESNVVEGVSYKANSLTNNKTGTVGSSTDPGVANVRRGTTYRISGVDKTGTLYAPAQAATRNWAPIDTQSAIYTLLATDDALIELLGEDADTVDVSTRVLDHVPDNQASPYVVIQIKPWEDRGNYTYEGLSATLTIHTWYTPGSSATTGRGDKQVQLIQKRIDEILHRSQLEIVGWSNLILRRSLVDILVEPDNVTRHGVQQFKLFVGGN